MTDSEHSCAIIGIKSEALYAILALGIPAKPANRILPELGTALMPLGTGCANFLFGGAGA